MTRVTTTNATQYAVSCACGSPSGPPGSPQLRSTGDRSSAKADAPNAADMKPARVTPIWTAARNRFGSACSAATRWPRRPRWDSARTWPSRSDTSAISDPAKNAPIRRKNSTSRALATVELTACHRTGGTPD